jgi:hypothetical protein
VCDSTSISAAATSLLLRLSLSATPTMVSALV